MAMEPARQGRLIPAQPDGAVVVAGNIDIGTWTGRAKIMAAANPSDYQPDKNGVVRITVTHWMCYADEGVDEETGELRQFARTVLFDKDGNTFRTTAAHAPMRLKTAMQLFSSEEWAAGIPFIIANKVGRRGRTYHDIRLGDMPCPPS